MADYLTDITYARLLGGLPENTSILPDKAFRAALAGAAAELAKHVGATYYATALAEVLAARTALEEGENLEDNATLGTLARALRDAETNLTLSKMIPRLNMNYRDGGIQVSAVTERGQINNMSIEGVRKLIMYYRHECWAAAHAYLSAAALTGYKSVAYDDAGEEI
jgi:hypothetical protein